MKILRWSGDKRVTFAVDATEIRLFSDIKLTGECSKETKDNDKSGKAKFKSAKPYKVTLNAYLYAALGIDVKKDALSMLKDARNGKGGYLYNGKKKLFKSKLMMTKCEISDVQILPGGTWVSCKAVITLQEGEGGSGDDSSSSKGNKNGKKKYYGYARWNGKTWIVIAGTPANANLYTTDVTISKKLYHGYKPSTTTPTSATNTDGASTGYESVRQYGNDVRTNNNTDGTTTNRNRFRK